MSQTLPDAPALEGWTAVYSGKVRNLYVPVGATGLADASAVLVVATDRVSAFDFVLEPGITDKGSLLTKLSLWWFDQLPSVPNHLLSVAEAAHAGVPGVPAAVASRAMLVKPLDMFPIEAVVRGYLVGSGWLEYQDHGTVCGIPLPAGLTSGDRLPEPIYTPAFKAEFGDHDENITYERTAELVGADLASALRDISLEVFRTASAIAERRGVILADTKFEFGADRATGEITLADEVLTSDSSRYWDAAVYASGNRTDSFDKQIVRNWLSANWNREGTPPVLPDEIVAQTAGRYRELLERLTAAD
ncbi:phosphoribosylaminoimidazolesuccinocarboxamide synthase [Frondihabitans sp. PAMC 28766]|uniref:phosphoribosylaminoimidazolesuccinocarboxamide synthase n=1 Tax=Frondihabitans sp. PAMC 28766 TaxID=1795630 RepID=UPI00078ECC96|nr:phosphoribosylaminoimidazolesuccinocarboxamide synthase [Frondihabitans sp. PAMC 28766]AMM19128.1 phosphoribosylaminoimidazolesuccinocarboxamide synthase [Frondihabitans sp. PAMC 28766]